MKKSELMEAAMTVLSTDPYCTTGRRFICWCVLIADMNLRRGYIRSFHDFANDVSLFAAKSAASDTALKIIYDIEDANLNLFTNIEATELQPVRFMFMDFLRLSYLDEEQS